MPTRRPAKKRPAGGAPAGNTNARRAESQTILVNIRVTPRERSTYAALARFRGQSFGDMVRALCNAALVQAVTQGGWQPPKTKNAKGD